MIETKNYCSVPQFDKYPFLFHHFGTAWIHGGDYICFGKKAALSKHYICVHIEYFLHASHDEVVSGVDAGGKAETRITHSALAL